MRFFAAVLMLTLAACSKPASDLSQKPPEAGGPAAPAAPPPGDPETVSAPPAPLDVYRWSGPKSRANLAIYLLHDAKAPQGDLGCLSLEEALRSGAVKVSEKGGGAEVNELQIENVGEKPVYLQAGDTVKGGQQDRTIAVDLVLPAASGKRGIEAFCVEPGRWSVRESAGVSTLSLPSGSFAYAEQATPVATKEQKLAVRLERSQAKVWEAGRQVNGDLKMKAGGPAIATATATLAIEEAKTSFVEAVEDPAVAKKVDEIVAALSAVLDGQADAVGAAFCVNGKLENLEIYAAAGLFRKLWPKLLRAAAVDAFSKTTSGEVPKPPSEAELRKLLSELEGQAGRAERRPDGPTVRIFEREHVVLFDTESDGKLLHRQVLAK